MKSNLPPSRLGAVLLVLCSYLSISIPAFGAQLSITAEFTPNRANPQLNRFVNTTPNSGYCQENVSQCEINKVFSLRVPITLNSSGPIIPLHSDQRQGAMVRAPTQWRDLTVVHTRTLEQETLKVRIAGFGSQVTTSNVVELVGGGVTAIQAHYLLWGSSWVYPPSPCQYSGVGVYTTTAYRFFWKTPVEGVCAKQAKYEVPWMRFPYIDFSYELITPNPLGMTSGEYVGTYRYTVGPQQDFDFGDVMIPEDSQVNLNFTLKVEHELQVEVPPGGNRVELVPQGGWQAWVNQGRKPARLFRDQTFNISASSRFKMQMACERMIGETCALRNTMDAHEVPVDVSVSLPHGFMRSDGSGVARQPLLLSGAGTEVFQPGFYISRRPGTLHFEVKKDYAAQMLTRGGTTYAGQVTVIWDADI
jgi:hypothetical protein